MEKKYYLIEIEGGVEAFARGPFDADDERNDAAKRNCATREDDDGLFWADVEATGALTVGSYRAAFLEDEPAHV